MVGIDPNFSTPILLKQQLACTSFKLNVRSGSRRARTGPSSAVIWLKLLEFDVDHIVVAGLIPGEVHPRHGAP